MEERILSLLVIFQLLVYKACLVSSTHTPSVKTTSGLVLGVTLPEAHGFYSVPYATPPVGDLRFQDPQPVRESSNPINATQSDYVVCYQKQQNCTGGTCYMNVKEDCLVLNIHVPQNIELSNPYVIPDTQLPVMVWIHGEGFLSGGGTSPLFDGRWLSNSTNTIIVSINYRLGILGFLVHGEGDDVILGNQGLKDQRMALKWVKENIQKFGGDRYRVTIFGHSAGAQSILFHTVSQESSPFFRRAIMQSCLSIHHQRSEEAKKTTKKMLNLLNCTGDERKCLMDAPAEVLVALQFNITQLARLEGDIFSEFQPFRPIIDGVEFTDEPLNIYRDGKNLRHKDIIIGANAEELYHFQYTLPPGFKFTRDDFRALSFGYFGFKNGIKVADKYESMMEPGDQNYAHLMGMEVTHMNCICPNRALARFASKAAKEGSNVYFYIYAYGPLGPYCKADEILPQSCGLAFHGSENKFLFQSGPSYGYLFNENDIAVANQFSNYWGSFARTGNVSSRLENPIGNFSYWPIYKEDSSRKWMNLEIRSPKELIRSEYLEDFCDFGDSLNFYFDISKTSSNP